MNEIEARGKIKYRIANEMLKYGENKEEYEDLEIALQVMKEIREYRELGTVEEFHKLKMLFGDENVEVSELTTKILKEYPKYKAIGTVEEFKALKEKNGWHDMEMYGLGYNQSTIDRADELQKCREQGYNKAIDDFAENLRPLLSTFIDRIRLDKIAEKMKGDITYDRE